MTQGSDGLLSAALEYARRGWPILPLVPSGKKPLTKHGHLDATTDPDQIAAWWVQHPRANVGIVTGDRSGILVIDVDGPEGDLALNELNAAIPTLTSLTATGRHLYFEHQPDIGCRVRFRLGLDVRGDGGYVVAPPSTHKSGWVYRWDEEHFMGLGTNPAPLPERIRQTLLVGNSAPAMSEGKEVLLEGRRNDGLTRLAGSVAASGRTHDEVLEEVLTLNAQRCVPPLPRGEVERIAGSIWHRECKSRQGDQRLPQRVSLSRPDVTMTFRWGNLYLRAEGLKRLGLFARPRSANCHETRDAHQDWARELSRGLGRWGYRGDRYSVSVQPVGPNDQAAAKPVGVVGEDGSRSANEAPRRTKTASRSTRRRLGSS